MIYKTLAGLEAIFIFTFRFYISVLTDGTGWQFLELIPIIYYFIATCPPFFSVMKDWHARVIAATSLFVQLLDILFETAWPFTIFIGGRSRHLLFC
jgi:hypothetical protein